MIPDKEEIIVQEEPKSGSSGMGARWALNSMALS
jgi:hypothetical protein